MARYVIVEKSLWQGDTWRITWPHIETSRKVAQQIADHLAINQGDMLGEHLADLKDVRLTKVLTWTEAKREFGGEDGIYNAFASQESTDFGGIVDALFAWADAVYEELSIEKENQEKKEMMDYTYDFNMERVEFVNLTPHELNIYDATGAILLFAVEPSGIVARCSEQRVDVGIINGVPVQRATYGDVDGLPLPEDGNVYIVSALVAQAITDRDDVYATGKALRDDTGRVIGCIGLSKI